MTFENTIRVSYVNGELGCGVSLIDNLQVGGSLSFQLQCAARYHCLKLVVRRNRDTKFRNCPLNP